MRLIEFIKTYPDEPSCKQYLRSLREKQGLICSKCGHKEHYWKKDKECWECKGCRKRTSLKSGTVMHSSQLPVHYWFVAMHLLSSTKKSFSALEIQHQLGHKYYEAIWTMVHKIRRAMGKRDGDYLLEGELELDEGMFTTFSLENSEPDDPQEDDDKKGETQGHNKRGRGSERKTAVLVMAESSKVSEKEHKKNRPERKVRHIKMIAITDAQKETIHRTVGQHVSNDATAITDGFPSYGELENEIGKVRQYVASGKEASKVLPWVHICISNAKRWFLGIYHSMADDYIQNYLSEFCYNFNRRYFREVFFDRLLIAAISNQNQFKPKFR